MINFIIYDDDYEFTQIIKKTIETIMFKKSEQYKIHIFNKYSVDFLRMIDSKFENKVYILDIEVPKKSGIEISKTIREKDWDSVIIILTSHYELEKLIYHSKLLILDVISKFDIYDKLMQELLNLSLKKFSKNDILLLGNKNNVSKINMSEILYITYETKIRGIRIETHNESLFFNKSLKEINGKLNSNFLYSHRNCIVNKNWIKDIDYKNKTIIFLNGKAINLVSRKYIGGLKQ